MERSMSGIKYDYLLKVKTVGDSNVGKSSIVVRFVDDTFSGLMAPTIGVEYKSKIFEVYGKKVKAIIWDTAGAERYRTITSNYYRGSHAIIFVYDVTCRSSFENVEKFWLKEVKQYFPNTNEIVMMLVGNKIDNIHNRQVSADKFGSELGPISLKDVAEVVVLTPVLRHRVVDGAGFLVPDRTDVTILAYGTVDDLPDVPLLARPRFGAERELAEIDLLHGAVD